MNYFDAHSHLDHETLAPHREEILHKMKEEGVGTCTIGVDRESSRRAVAIARSCENVWACIGQHPVDNAEEAFQSSVYQKLIDEHPDEVICIGECGLDYYWLQKNLDEGVIDHQAFTDDKLRQRLLFHQQITLALANNLPLMLHIRSSADTEDAHLEALEILDQFHSEDNLRVIFHFYTGSVQLAQAIISRGFYISLPGVITFKNAGLEEMVRTLPLSQILAETDSPYAAPTPHRGTTNSPLYVEHVYHKIAELHGIDQEKVRRQILKNTEDIFAISL